MDIRLVGTKGECEVVIARLRKVLTLIEVDGPKTRRGDGLAVSYYVNARIPSADDPPASRSLPVLSERSE